jgi:cyanate permease
MSDEPKNRSHTVRLAVSMVVGVLVGSIFVQMALPWTAVICTLGGAIGGLALELFRRSLATADQNDALRSPRQSLRAVTQRRKRHRR